MARSQVGQDLLARLVERDLGGRSASVEANDVPAEARLHGLAQVPDVLQREGGIAERGIHLAWREKSELAAIALGGGIVGSLSGELGEVCTADELRARFLRQGQCGVAAAVPGRIEKDVRRADLLRCPVLVLVEDVDLARLGDELILAGVEFGSGIALDLADHGLRQEAIDLEREPARDLVIAIEADIARLLRERLVDKQLVEQLRQPLGAGGELGAHLRGDAQEVGVVFGAGKLHESVLGQNFVAAVLSLGDAIGGGEECGKGNCGDGALHGTSAM